MLKTKQRNLYYSQKITFFIVYGLGTWSRESSSIFILRSCLFGCVKLANNVDLHKYVYSGYGIGLKQKYLK